MYRRNMWENDKGHKKPHRLRHASWEDKTKTVCPRCSSTRVKRSRTRNLRERIMKHFDKKAYRCLDCGWRGILRVKKMDGHGAMAVRRNSRKPQELPWAAIIIVSLLLAFALVVFMMREPAPSSPEPTSSLSRPIRHGQARVGGEITVGERPV